MASTSIALSHNIPRFQQLPTSFDHDLLSTQDHKETITAPAVDQLILRRRTAEAAGEEEKIPLTMTTTTAGYHGYVCLFHPG